ncbi:MAG TPA: hypothetical protein VH391_00895 [Solirubrobacterales bacterium]|jgi:hypothetical protein
MRRIRHRLTYANVMATLAVFLVIGGGTALGAFVVSNNSQVGPNTIYGHSAAAGKNKNVVESSLSQVPAAVLGGLGRSNGSNTCNPEYPPGDFFPCAVVTIDLKRSARVLVIGQGYAVREDSSSPARGNCRIGTTSGPLNNSLMFVTVDAPDHQENFSTSTVTGVFPPGQHSFGLDCREESNSTSGILYFDVGVTAVALSSG